MSAAVMVLAIAGVWLLLGSPFSASEKDTSRTQMSENKLYNVVIRPELDPIALNQIHNWIVQVTTKEGQPLENAQISVSGDMPEHEHGLPSAPGMTEALGNGEYQLDGFKFTMPGWWVVEISITANNQTDIARFNLIL
jgi:hypothetical protein